MIFTVKVIFLYSSGFSYNVGSLQLLTFSDMNQAVKWDLPKNCWFSTRAASAPTTLTLILVSIIWWWCIFLWCWWLRWIFQCLHSLMTDWPSAARTKRQLFTLWEKAMELDMANQYLAVPVTSGTIINFVIVMISTLLLLLEDRSTRKLSHWRWWVSVELYSLV